MRHRDVIDVYNSIIKQIKGRYGKKVNITYPYGSNNVIVSDFEATQEIYDRFVARRNYLLGGK
jgi:hypothetical protein